MAKYFKRGNYKLITANSLRSETFTTISNTFKKISASTSEKTNLKNLNEGNLTPFTKTLIIRGIGYRVFLIENDFTIKSSIDFIDKIGSNDSLIENSEESYSFWNDVIENEQKYMRYLLIRAGHTQDKFIPLPNTIYIKTLKKDRKLVIFGMNKQHVSEIAYKIFSYRKPSVYTGRGIRRKKIKVLRKIGKKDKR